MEEQIEKIELLGQFLSKAMDWWNGLSGENKIFRLIAYEQAFNIKINYPTEEQVMALYYLELQGASAGNGA